MESAVMMDELTWMEYTERIAMGAPVLVVAGATEQHGPHLPLGTDVFQGMAIAREVAKRTEGCVAPPIAYGYKSQPKSGGGQSFVGTTSLDGQTLTLLVRDLIREFLRHGVRRLVFIDGHTENAMFLTEGIDLALREARTSVPRILVFRWAEMVSQRTIEEIFGDEFPGWPQEHAAVFETSVMAAIHPELVHWERLIDDRAETIPVYDVHPAPPEMVSQSGILSPARRASRSHGEKVVAEVVSAIVSSMEREFRQLQG